MVTDTFAITNSEEVAFAFLIWLFIVYFLQERDRGRDLVIQDNQEHPRKGDIFTFGAKSVELEA